MILYSMMILLAWVLIISLNAIINIPIYNFDLLYIIFGVVVSTIAVIAIDGATAGLVRLLPNKWFNPMAKRYRVYKWEKRFYEAIGIKIWKESVPELGHLTKFRKNKIADPANNDYVYRFLLEIVYGRVGHAVSCVTGFLIIFIFPLEYALCFGVPVAVVNAIMNYMPIAILRYNFPKLMALYRMNERKNRKIDKTKK
ncbi:MAG: hypothetical protein E7361_04400 [Clostridiales bacterium]|nr:hypothetical protein [Clostridiales bacterium]